MFPRTGLRTGRGREDRELSPVLFSALRNVGSAWGFPLGGLRGLLCRKGNDEEKNLGECGGSKGKQKSRNAVGLAGRELYFAECGLSESDT